MPPAVRQHHALGRGRELDARQAVRGAHRARGEHLSEGARLERVHAELVRRVRDGLPGLGLGGALGHARAAHRHHPPARGEVRAHLRAQDRVRDRQERAGEGLERVGDVVGQRRSFTVHGWSPPIALDATAAAAAFAAAFARASRDTRPSGRSTRSDAPPSPPRRRDAPPPPPPPRPRRRRRPREAPRRGGALGTVPDRARGRRLRRAAARLVLVRVALGVAVDVGGEIGPPSPASIASVASSSSSKVASSPRGPPPSRRGSARAGAELRRRSPATSASTAAPRVVSAPCTSASGGGRARVRRRTRGAPGGDSGGVLRGVGTKTPLCSGAPPRLPRSSFLPRLLDGGRRGAVRGLPLPRGPRRGHRPERRVVVLARLVHLGGDEHGESERVEVHRAQRAARAEGDARRRRVRGRIARPRAAGRGRAATARGNVPTNGTEGRGRGRVGAVAGGSRGALPVRGILV